MSSSNFVTFLEGKKVVLRPVNKSTDLESFQRWINDPKIRHWLTRRTPMTVQGEADWFDNLSARKDDIILAIVSKADGRLIGNIGLHSINWIDRQAVTGCMIGQESDRGQGFGKDAKMTLLAYAFLTLNLHKVCSMAFADNERSLRYNRSCGYRDEGILRQHLYRDGVYHDAVSLAVLKEKWLPLWEEWQKA